MQTEQQQEEPVGSTPELQEELGSDPNMGKVAEFVETIWIKHKDLESLQMDRYGFGAWSVSKLKVLQKCPLQFYLQYVLKIKVPKDVGGREDSLSADVGSAGHRILELVMTGKTVSEGFAITKKEFVPEKLTEDQWEEHVTTLEMSILFFKDRMDRFDRQHKIKRVFTEMRVAVTKDWESCAFFDKDAYFRGIIDLCIQLDNLDLVVIDHKTASADAPMSIRPFEFQLNSYKPLFHYGIQPIAGSQAGVHFIRAADVKMGEYHDRNQIENKLRKEIEWSFDGAVDTVKELGFFKHIAGNQCKWCEYASMCKSKDKLLKPLELDTKRLIKIKKA